jgi:hypothetical protein
VAIDPDAFDFHQALTALEVHPRLQRALGLVFDLELPLDLMPAAAALTPSNLSVQSTTIAWQLPPKSAPLETACVHVQAGNVTLFTTASRTQTADGGPLQVFGLLNHDPARASGRRRRDAQGDHDGGDLQQSRPAPKRVAGGSRTGPQP